MLVILVVDGESRAIADDVLLHLQAIEESLNVYYTKVEPISVHVSFFRSGAVNSS